jgi:hypothetical protein
MALARDAVNDDVAFSDWVAVREVYDLTAAEAVNANDAVRA